jgi:alkylation response protein AidB-like acyl-CoA dehydrogenase
VLFGTIGLRRCDSVLRRAGNSGGARSHPDPWFVPSSRSVRLSCAFLTATHHARVGGNGYINEYPTGRILRDAKLYEIGAGTSEIRRMLIGRELYNDTA